MAATASKTDMPTFSYAQAAKGLSTSNTSQQTVKPPTEQGAGTSQENESSKGLVLGQTSNTTSVEVPRDSDKKDFVADPESKSTTTGSSKNVVSGTSSPSIGTASTSTLAKDDDIPAIPNGTSDSTWDKQSQASNQVEKTGSVGENKDEAAKSEKNAPQKELKAAPIPAVNIWQQRKEAQEAKAKANAAVLKSAASITKAAAPKSTNGDSVDSTKTGNKKKPTNDSQADASGSFGKDRKRAEAGKPREEGSKKSGNRTARPNEESSSVSLPPVADATAWPTPQTALGEEKRKAQEKGDKSEKTERSPSIRGKEKWTPVHYVPTAVFNTPLPSGARRGGRPSRGGRESGRGGAHNSNNNTTAEAKSASTQTNQAPAKHANVPERGRNESNLVRANSLPAQGRKPASTEGNAQPDQKRHQHTVDRPRADARPKPSEETNATPNGSSSSTADAPSKPHRENRLTKAPEFTPAQNSRPGNPPSEGQVSRHASTNERRFDGPLRSSEVSRDSNGFIPREREHREYHREKGDFQRDREHPKERGESRPERGRGGYRGRGGHSYGAGSQNQHFQNSQHPFSSTKSFGINERQRSQQQNFQNGTQSQHANHRMPLRSPSLPNSAGLYSAYPLPEINTMYPGYPAVPAGPMTAIPYPQYMEPINLMSMIQMQLEYYFSVDNLCKDLYLRKHMDSQGFVRLSVIAGFKRIKNLTEDYELLRHSSRQLRGVEYLYSEDGQDRLRPRDKWEQWVLPLDQRDPSAQNDGYSPAQFHPLDIDNVAVPMTNGFGHHGSQSPNGITNGNHDYAAARTTLSSAAPEFTPFVPVASQNDTVNRTAQ